MRRSVGSKNRTTTPTTTSTTPGTPITGLRERGNDTSRSTGCSGRQKAATRRNMRRGERVTVQGPVKKQQPDGMSHGRGGGADVRSPCHVSPPLVWQDIAYDQFTKCMWLVGQDIMKYSTESMEKACPCAPGRAVSHGSPPSATAQGPRTPGPGVCLKICGGPRCACPAPALPRPVWAQCVQSNAADAR